ncbi:hypothetical protein CsSME_00016843 [Camellia sinensis var. sinensis]
MANYHFVYKDAEGALTQWDDIQRKLGNLPPKPPAFKPSSFKPTKDEDSKHKDKAHHRDYDNHRRLRLSVKFSLLHLFVALTLPLFTLLIFETLTSDFFRARVGQSCLSPM